MKCLKFFILVSVFLPALFLMGCEDGPIFGSDPFFHGKSALIVPVANGTPIENTIEIDAGRINGPNDTRRDDDNVYTFFVPLSEAERILGSRRDRTIVVGEKYPAIYNDAGGFLCVPGSSFAKDNIILMRNGSEWSHVEVRCPDGGIDIRSISDNWKRATIQGGDLRFADFLQVSVNSQGRFQFYEGAPDPRDCEVFVEMDKRIIWIDPDEICMNDDISFVINVKINEFSTNASQHQLGEFFRGKFEFFSVMIIKAVPAFPSL